MKKSSLHFIFMRWSLLAVVALALNACAKAGSNSLVPEGRVPVTTSAVVHYGKGIGVAEFYINGRLSGHKYGGWGSSGESCCMSMARHPIQPLMVTVKWKTYRTSFKEERWHEATVPVNFAENEPGYIYVHFFPGHRVEVWSSAKYGPGNPKYPGPTYPYQPAPDYVPLPDETPEPKKGKQI